MAKDILERANAAITKGDYEGSLAFCSEDTHWTFLGDRVLAGKAAVRRWMAETYRSPPVLEVTGMIAEGDLLTAYGEVTVEDKTGKPVRSAYADIWRIRDGKLSALRAYVVELSGTDA